MRFRISIPRSQISRFNSQISLPKSLVPAGILLLAILIAAATDTNGPDLGPDVVILDQLVEHYQPVPFDHKGHATMAEMWNGCVTCHHHTPVNDETRMTNDDVSSLVVRQSSLPQVPACKSCHPIARNGDDLRVPNLKGAYHRQCLGCHREWTGENHCQACHEPLDPKNPQPETPTPAGILSRMHPPIPEPDEKIYRTRFTPAVGANVLFRHNEHTETHGVRCASCHVRENCAQCHTANGQTAGPQPMRRGRTWADTHKPCSNCHQTDRCRTCHYTDDQPGPLRGLEDDALHPSPGPQRLIRASERLRQSNDSDGG